MFTWKLHKQKCVSCLFVAEVWVLQKHMQRDSYTLSHDQWIQCDLAVKIWEFWRLRGPARKWITWRSNWRCSAERSFHWLLFWMHHVLTIPGRLFSWFSWHQFFFSNKIWCGSMYFFICNYLESKRFWYTNWILTHGVSNVGPRKLEEKLGSKLDGEELLPVVKGPASSFDELIELLSSKNGNKNGKPLKKRYKMRIYLYIHINYTINTYNCWIISRNGLIEAFREDELCEHLCWNDRSVHMSSWATLKMSESSDSVPFLQRELREHIAKRCKTCIFVF